jgi:hypothetical protein
MNNTWWAIDEDIDIVDARSVSKLSTVENLLGDVQLDDKVFEFVVLENYFLFSLVTAGYCDIYLYVYFCIQLSH